MLLLSIALLFVAVLVVPAIPGILEVVRPRDDGRLYIAEAYVRDARWFGRAFRKRLEPFVSAARTGAASDGSLHMRTDETVRWAPDLAIPPLDRVRGIGVGERVVVGHGAGIRDAYALERLVVERDVVARTLTSDDELHVGAGVRVLRWLDADGAITVASGSDLGVSASGGTSVELGDRVHFERVWGAPVRTATGASDPFPLVKPPRETIVDDATKRAGGSVIAYGHVRVAGGTDIAQHLKIHGHVAIEPGVRIGGNVIARGDVTLAAGVTVGGHIFAEGNVRLGPGTRVSRSGVAKSVYATGDVILANDVEVFGWVVSETGGRTE